MAEKRRLHIIDWGKKLQEDNPPREAIWPPSDIEEYREFLAAVDAWKADKENDDER